MFDSSSPLIQSVFQLSHFVMEYPQNNDVLSPKIFKEFGLSLFAMETTQSKAILSPKIFKDVWCLTLKIFKDL